MRTPTTPTTRPPTATPTSSPWLPRTTGTPWLRSRTSGRAPWMRSAPGLNVYSTLSTSSGSAYGYYSGTSMGTPHVAGVAPHLKSQQPTLDDAQLKTRILDGVDAKGTLSGRVLKGGRLNPANALPASHCGDGERRQGKARPGRQNLDSRRPGPDGRHRLRRGRGP